ncbi:unnamed protein product, partial [Discosporangium mesarthrocarpum]
VGRSGHHVQAWGGCVQEEKGTGARSERGTGVLEGGRRVEVRQGQEEEDAGSRRDSQSRSKAATVVQRAFRGHKGRRLAARTRRVRDHSREVAAEEELEREREASKASLRGRIPRPKMQSTYGF